MLEPAESYAILTLEELKAILNIPETDTAEDDQLSMWIDQYSDVVTPCNRGLQGDSDKVESMARRDSMPPD